MCHSVRKPSSSHKLLPSKGRYHDGADVAFLPLLLLQQSGYCGRSLSGHLHGHDLSSSTSVNAARSCSQSAGCSYSGFTTQSLQCPQAERVNSETCNEHIKSTHFKKKQMGTVNRRLKPHDIHLNRCIGTHPPTCLQDEIACTPQLPTPMPLPHPPAVSTRPLPSGPDKIERYSDSRIIFFVHCSCNKHCNSRDLTDRPYRNLEKCKKCYRYPFANRHLFHEHSAYI